MNLKQFNGKCVKITNVEGDVYEGYCMYNNPDYNEHEFGRHESSLEIASFLFFKKDIKEIESLEEYDGPYGCFSNPFGKLEEVAVEEGIGCIEDVLFCENDEHSMRMIRCLEHHFDKNDEKVISIKDEIIEALEELSDYPIGDDVKQEALRLKRRIPINNDKRL